MIKTLLLTAAASIALTSSVIAQEGNQNSNLTPEQIEEIRRTLAEQEAAEVSAPEEILNLRQRQLDAQAAQAVPGYTADSNIVMDTRRIVVASHGAAQPHDTQSLTLAEGAISSVAFFDNNGVPWPVQTVAYDRNRISVNNEGCADQGGEFDSLGNVLVVRPCSFWTQTNMQVLLVGETRPIPFSVRSGSREDTIVADGLLTVAVNSNAPRPMGRDRLGQLDNSWVVPAARTMTIDPIDTVRDRAVNQVFVTPGVTTDIAFMDGNRNPWPIEEIAFAPGIVAVNGPCDPDEAGIKTTQPEEGTSTLYLTPCQSANATVAVRLQGRAGALSLMIVPARQGERQPDGTLSVTVPGVSPVTPALTAASAAVAGLPGGRGSSVAFNHDRYLNDFLMGTPPQGARRASITGGQGVEGWIFDGALYLRGSFQVINPAYDASARSSDGSLFVWKYGPPVSRILGSDLSGREVVLSISY
jgi:hypothetical protein